jgi:hypothetical protein
MLFVIRILFNIDRAADCMNEKSGYVTPQVKEIFLFPTPSILVLGPSWPPLQLVTGALFPRVKRSAREGDR